LALIACPAHGHTGKYFLADRPTEEGQELIIREVRLNKSKCHHEAAQTVVVAHYLTNGVYIEAMQKAASATKMYGSDHIYPPSSAPKKSGCSRTPQHKTEILVVEG
jgi:hypothetical protein